MYFLIPLCLFAAGLFLLQERKEKYVPAVILKGLASLCFVVFGILASPGGPTAELIVTGLILGCIADVMLNLRFVFPGKGKLVFLAGILVFLGGHIVYLAALLPLAENRIIPLAAGIILTAVIMKWLFTKITAEKAFKIFGIVYIGAVVLLNCFAFSILLTDPSAFSRIFSAGAFLFLLSDIILILNTFGSVQRFSLRICNIMLYYTGQLLIALSLLFPL